MARPKKRPEYNKDAVQDEFIRMISHAYLNPPKGTEDSNGHMSMKILADEFQITPIKVRKILVTAGVYETETSRQVNELYNEGKPVSDICKIMNLSVASVNGYLPYKKAIYSMTEKSLLAERLEKFRARKLLKEKLEYSMKNESVEEQKVRFKEALEAYAGLRFQTDTGVRFDYTLEADCLQLSADEVYTERELFEIIEFKKMNVDERLEVVFKRIGVIK